MGLVIAVRPAARGRPLPWRAAAALLLGLAAPALGAGPAPPGEYDVKAAYLVHFARLTEWPAPASRDDPFVIAVIGQDPFGDALDRAARDQRAHGRPIQVRRYGSADAVRDLPQIAYISTSPKDLSRVLGRFEGSPVLTVGDDRAFVERGGVVGFRVTPEQRVRFDISLRGSARQGLRISSEVLKLARVVDRPSP
jgi:hypothetical protein